MRIWTLGFVVWVMAACDKGDGKGLPGWGGKAAKVPAGSAAAVPVAAPAPAPAPPTGTATPTEPAPPTAAAGAPAPPPPPAAVAWKVDDRIQGKWSDGRWYNGRISAVNDDGSYNIKYDYGDVSNHFGKERVRGRGAAPAGGQSHASGGASNAPCPGPGLTRRCGGVCVNIQEDDNNCGSCGTRCSGGKHCDGHMFCRDASGNL